MSAGSQQHEVAAEASYQDLGAVDFPCVSSVQDRLTLTQSVACGSDASSRCYTSGYLCPLCALKGLVRLYHYVESGMYPGGSYAGGVFSKVFSRQDDILCDWVREQSRLRAVSSSTLYLGGHSNSLLRGQGYTRYYGLPTCPVEGLDL